MDSDEPGYKDLVDQVAELQGLLTKTMAVCTQLRTDNKTIKQTLDKHKTENHELRAKLLQARRQAMEEAQAAVASEQRHERLVESWKKQLEEKSQEFVELQTKMAPPGDIEMLKLKIQEELEGPHHAKVAALEDQIEKFKAMFFTVRRSHEMLKTELEQLGAEKIRAEQALVSKHNSEVAKFRAEIESLRIKAMDDQSSLQLRALEQELHQVKAKNEALQTEIKNTVAKAQLIHTEGNKAQISRIAELSHAQSELKSKQMEIVTLERQLSVMETQQSQSDRIIEDLKQQLSESRTEIAKLKHKLETEKSAAAEANAQHIRELEAKRSELATEKQELLMKLSTLQSDNQSLELNQTKVASELNQRINRLVDENNKLRKEVAESSSKHAEKLSEYNREATRREKEADTQQRELQERIERLEQQLESANFNTKRVDREKDVLHERLQNMQEKLTECEEQIERVQNRNDEIEREYSNLQSKHRKLISNERELVEAKKQAEMSLAYLEKEYSNLEERNTKLQESYTNLLSDAENQRKIANQTATQAQQDVSQVLHAQKQMAQNALAATKQKSKAYAESLKKCKKKLEEYKQLYKHQSQEFNAERELHQSLLEASERRARQAERERELIIRKYGTRVPTQQLSDDETTTSRVLDEEKAALSEVEASLDSLKS